MTTTAKLIPLLKREDREKKLRSDLCLKCFECCKLTVIPTAYDKDNKEALEFYEAKGFKVVKFAADLLHVVIAIDCANLTPFGCKIYANRPKWCKIYDGRLDPFVPVCLWNKSAV